MKTEKNTSKSGPKSKGGRPVKGVKKSCILMVRLTHAEKFMIESRAKDAGLKPSEWFRKAANSARIVPRLLPQEAEHLRMLAGLANNLNQLTHLAHAAGFFSVVVKCGKLLDQTEQIIINLFQHDREKHDR